MNRLPVIVAGEALAAGEAKWYQDSARLLNRNVLKSGATGPRQETTHHCALAPSGHAHEHQPEGLYLFTPC